MKSIYLVFSHHKAAHCFSFLDYDNIGEDIDLQNQPQQDSAEPSEVAPW